MLSSMSDMEELSQREALVARHKAEKKQLQGKLIQLKKSINKDKKRKKEVQEEIAALEHNLQAKHEAELAELMSEKNNSLANNVESLALLDNAEAVDEIEDDDKYPARRISKAEKRRQKKAQANKEREELIKECKRDNQFSVRNIEMTKMKNMLKQLKLSSYDIKSDGDCLFAAIAHQLSDGKTIRDLRSLASSFMRAHTNDFLPFITNPSSGDLMTPDQFEDYCQQMEDTSCWGGQPEAEGEPILFGEEFGGATICLLYYRHLYELGEHYNSTVPLADTES